MSIIEHAKSELDRINFGTDDTMVMIDILERFFEQWDSGGAVSVAAPVLCRLLEGKPLAPLTGAADEWIDRTEVSGRPMWQNVRAGTVFKDETRAWDIELPGDGTITFPYDPETRGVAAPVITVPDGYEFKDMELIAPGHVVFKRDGSLEKPDLDEEFFQGQQWTPEQVAILKSRQLIKDEEIAALRAQLQAEGEHTAAASAEIDRLNTEIERITRQQQGVIAEARRNGIDV